MFPRLITREERRQLRELAALHEAMDARAGDQALMLFSRSYADACERFEKATDAKQSIQFTVVKKPMQEAIGALLWYYRDLAYRVATGA
jgi:hypothetical protein